MVKLTLSSPLFELLPETEQQKKCAPRSVLLNPGSWEEISQEIQARFPLLGKRVLSETATVANSFLLVVNKKVVRNSDRSLQLSSGDEIFILAAIAGG
jgi:sulfur carrier protein ThiS